MIKKAILISLLSAVTLAACDDAKKVEAPRPGEKKVIIGGPGKEQLESLQKYTKSGEWVIVEADGRRGYRKMLISKGEGEQRVVEPRSGAGYTIWLVDINCKRMAFRDHGPQHARLSDGDKKLPMLRVDKNARAPDILNNLSAICGKGEAKSFKAPMIQAVSSLRSAETGKIERPAPPAASKYGPNPSKMKIIGRDGKVTYQDAPTAIGAPPTKQN